MSLLSALSYAADLHNKLWISMVGGALFRGMAWLNLMIQLSDHCQQLCWCTSNSLMAAWHTTRETHGDNFPPMYIHGLVQERWNSSALAMELHISCINPSVDGLVQERCNSSALAMELHLSCINPSVDGLVQERCNSSALAMELRLSWINPSIYHKFGHGQIYNYNHIFLRDVITYWNLNFNGILDWLPSKWMIDHIHKLMWMQLLIHAVYLAIV